MTAFDKKVNQIAARHGWSIEKQPRAAVECYIIDAATYEDAGKIAAALNRCKGLHLETLSPLHYESWAVNYFLAELFAGAAVVHVGRCKTIAGHSFPCGVHNVPRHTFPRMGGGGCQIFFYFFWDSN